MPVFFQQQIGDHTRLGIWKIEETEAFFKGNVPQHRDVTHPHKRLQHLAGRFLLQFLFPDFPYELIRIADTRRPFLPDEQYHFSISHCGDYAAAIVSRDKRVGIDIEIPVEKVERIRHKFLSAGDRIQYSVESLASQKKNNQHSIVNIQHLTLLWSAKESVFKWYGKPGVDFRENILLIAQDEREETIECFFTGNNQQLAVHYRLFEQVVLAWVVSDLS